MNKYLNSKIYKLVDNTNGNIYIGSTIQTIEKRLKGHKNKYNGYLNGRTHYTTSHNIIKNGNYKIELIENYQCENKKQLEEREGFYIKNIDCINKRVEGRTRKEINKNYSENNKDKIKEYKSQTFDCICGSILTINHRKKHFKTIKHINFMDSITD